MKRVLSILIWTLAAAFGCNASTWFVKVDGGTSTSGTMWTTSWNFDTFLTKLSDGTIEEGDMVCFAGGVYRSNEVNPINIKHLNLTLKGGFPTNLRINQVPELKYPTETPTLFLGDSNGSGQPDDYDVRNFICIDGSAFPDAERNIVIEGFTISGCFYEARNSQECGAVSVYLSRGVTLQHCILEGNRALYSGGAALNVLGSEVKVVDCIFKGNKAGTDGAAIRADEATLAQKVYMPALIVDRTLIEDNMLTATDEYPEGGNTPEMLYNGIVLPSVWPPKSMSPQSREPMPVPYLEEENIPAVIPINVGRQLFVDDFLISSAQGIERKWYRPEKYSANPILKVETTLEQYAAGNPGAAPKDGGIYWNEEQKQWQMWYEAGWLNAQAYATSRDGLNWERPTLGIGVLNQIIPGYAPNSSGVVVDYDAPAYERYKIYFRPPNDKAESNVYGYAAISSDGIHWNNLIRSGATRDRSTLFYNPFRKKYVFSLRNGGGLAPAPHGRNRWYRESSNFFIRRSVEWSECGLLVWCRQSG